jgi:CHASE3 domain sensor protein
MKRLPRLPVWGSLAAHLILAIVLLIAFIGILGTIVVWRAEQAAQAGALTRDKYEAAANTDRADTYWLTSSSVTGAYLLFHDPTYPDLIQQIQQQTLAEIDKAIGVERRLGEGDDVDSLVAIRAQIVQVQDLTNRMVDAANAGDSATVQQLTPQIISQGSQLEPTLRAFGDHERADVSEASADSARAASTLTWVLIAAIMTIIIAGAGAAYYVARAVMRPLSHLRHAANAIGRGDLSVRA